MQRVVVQRGAVQCVVLPCIGAARSHPGTKGLAATFDKLLRGKSLECYNPRAHGLACTGCFGMASKASLLVPVTVPLHMPQCCRLLAGFLDGKLHLWRGVAVIPLHQMYLCYSSIVHV